MSLKYLVIINQNANKNKTKQNWNKLSKFLDSNRIGYSVKVSRYRQHLDFLTQQDVKAAKPGQSILVIGGDGTLNHVVNSAITTAHQLEKKYVPIAFFPTGNGNYFAHQNHLPLQLSKFIQNVILKGTPTPLQIGCYADHMKHQTKYFVYQQRISFDPRLEELLQKPKRDFLHLHLARYIINDFYNVQTYPLEFNIPDHLITLPNVFLTSIRVNTHGNLKMHLLERQNLLKRMYNCYQKIRHHPLKYRTQHYYTEPQFNLTIPSLVYNELDGENNGNQYFDVDYRIIKYPFIK